jgi:hypothetical protein
MATLAPSIFADPLSRGATAPIAIVSAYVSKKENARESELAVAGLRASLDCYARKHGHEVNLVTTDPPDLPYPMYVKVRAFQEVFERRPQTQWVLWLDADARILNFTFSLSDLIREAGEDAHVLAVSQWPGHAFHDSRWPHCPIIACAFLLRNSSTGRRFLRLWAELARVRHEAPQHDQLGFVWAMAALLTELSDAEILDRGGLFMRNLTRGPTKDPALGLAAQVEARGMKCYNRTHATASIQRIGPLALLPAYPLGAAFASMLGPGSDALSQTIKTISPFPFFSHAKYSPFCMEGVLDKTGMWNRTRAHLQAAESGDLVTRLRQRYEAELDTHCTVDEKQRLVQPSLRLSYAAWQRVCFTVLSGYEPQNRTASESFSQVAAWQR